MKEGKPVSAHSGENGCGSRAERNGNRDLCALRGAARPHRGPPPRARALHGAEVRVGVCIRVDFVYVYGILNSSNTHL